METKCKTDTESNTPENNEIPDEVRRAYNVLFFSPVVAVYGGTAVFYFTSDFMNAFFFVLISLYLGSLPYIAMKHGHRLP